MIPLTEFTDKLHPARTIRGPVRAGREFGIHSCHRSYVTRHFLATP
jgi:hypothetical protein